MTALRVFRTSPVARRLAVFAMALSLLALPLGGTSGTAEAVSGADGHGGIECEGKLHF